MSFGDEIESGPVFDGDDDVEEELDENSRVQRLRLRSDISLTEGKYRGKPSSRAKFDFGTLNASGDEESEDEGGESDVEMGDAEGVEESGDEEESSDEEEAGDLQSIYGAADEMQAQLQQLQEQATKEATIKLVSDTRAQLEKAQHAKNQKSLWDSALQLRIKEQRLVGLAGRLPQGPMLAEFCRRDEEAEQLRQEVSSGIQEVLALLLEMGCEQKAANGECEEALPDFFPRLEDDGRKARKRRRQALQCGEAEEATAFFWKRIKQYEESFAPFQARVLEQWNRKTQLSSRISMSKFKSINQNVMAQVEAVMREPGRLIERTHGKPAARVLGRGERAAEEDEKDPELFDDASFYQQLLRELIEQETNSADGVDISRAWLKSRALSKKKTKDVDRRASKGRKIRYTVHEKLVDFMTPTEAPVPEVAASLYKNLFQ